MELAEFEFEIAQRHPEWKCRESSSGIAKWINIQTSSSTGFALQITPGDGIGVSKLPRDNELDFGHDEVFNDLSDALRYVEGEFLAGITKSNQP